MNNNILISYIIILIGKIAEVKIKNKGGSNFFGFVEFDEERDASAALHKWLNLITPKNSEQNFKNSV